MPLEVNIKQQELNRNPFLCSWNGASLQLALSPITALPRLLPTTWHPPLLHCACVLALPLELFFHLPRRLGCRPTHQLSSLNLSSTVQTLLWPCHMQNSMMPLLWLSWLVPEELGEWFCLCRRKGDCYGNWFQHRPYQLVAFATLILTTTCGKVTQWAPLSLWWFVCYMVNRALVDIECKWFTPSASPHRRSNNLVLNDFTWAWNLQKGILVSKKHPCKKCK